MSVPTLTLAQRNAPSGAAILDDLDDLLADFVAFPSDEARHAVVLWVGHAHAINAFESTPRLALLSPEKGSGKTRTLEVLNLVVPNPRHAVNMSAAALYRVVAEFQPTLLLDEADACLGPMVAKQHEDLRALINAGHRRGAEVYRAEVNGKNVKTIAFPAFTPAALAGIGDLPDTIIDRSIVVTMRRRAQHEEISPFRERLVRPRAEQIRDRLAAWTAEHLDALTDAWPTMPEGITDRAADVWEPLLAIADAAGGDWPEMGRAAAVKLNAARQAADPSLGIQLLTDCRRILDDLDADRITTEDLVAALCALDDAPWGDLRGKPIDARGVARRLKKYDARPGDHRFNDGTKKGYLREAFHDAWSRYLPPVAHVAHVAHPQPCKGESSDVAHVAFEDGYVNKNKTQDIPFGTASNGQHGQQGQHPRSEPVVEELF